MITTPFSFISSANCILFERGIPIFVDIDPITYNIDPAQVTHAVGDLIQGGEAAKQWLPRNVQYSISKAHQLKAILPIDAFGQPADYDPIKIVADKHDLIIIEDSCEAIGSEYKGQKAGTLGDIGTFAFYPNKQITTGEGGILVTDQEKWADLFRSLRNQGRDLNTDELNYRRLGYNYRMDEMSAALGLSQLHRIEELLTKRAQVAKWFTDRLIGFEGIQTPNISSTTTRMSWFVYVIRIKSKIIRDQIMKRLEAEGIPSRSYFTPIHLQPFYRNKFGYQRGDFPETELAGDTCLALPFSSIMTEDQVDYVCGKLRSILKLP